MADDLQRIRSLLRGLVLRERLLLGARVAFRTAALLAACLVFVFAAPLATADRASGVFGLVVLAGAGAWAAAAWPLLREWSSAADPLRQAGRIEALRPDLRGRLLTAVDAALGGPVPQDRAALLGLVVARAAKGVQGVRPGHVHRARAVLPSAAAAAAAGVVMIAAAGVVGPTRAAAFWLRGSEALAAVAAVVAEDPGEVSKVGDLTLRYTFPDYTGLEPKVVANGTGDVAAPVGTRVEVTARAAIAAEAAGLVAYDAPLEASLDPDGRGLHGAFTVGADEGAWRFVLYRGGASEPSREFAITPEQDLPPDVTLAVEDGLDVLEVPVDRLFPVEWAARDDFGVSKASLAIDGKEVGSPLDRPTGRRADVQGKRGISARDLGLAPGDRVRLSVVAWDNDTVSGSKRGESRAVEIVVLGADGSGALSDARRDQLLDALIPVLAATLVEPWPPGDTGGELARWGEGVAARYQPVSELADELWRGRTGASLERTAVEEALKAGQSLVRYTQTAFEPGSAEEPPADNVRMTAELRTTALERLEDAVAALAQLQRNAAYGEIARRTRDLDETAARLQETLAGEDPDAQEILAQLDQLEAQLQRLAEVAARLGDSPLREYVQGRESEIRNLMDEVRKALAEGRTDEARKLAERLSQMMSDLAEGARQQMESASRESDESAEQAAELEKELRQLEREQRELQREAQALRDQDEQERAGEIWRRIEQKADEHVAAAEAWGAGVASARRPFHERQRAEMGLEEAEDLRASAAARDARGARMRLQSARNAWASARRAYEQELQRRQDRPPGPGREALQTLQEQLDAIDALLDELEDQQAPDPAQRQRAQELEERQRQLEQRTREATERAKEVGQQMQVEPRGMGESLDQAGQRMQDASDDLRDGRPMQAEGSQGQAAERLREAADALQQARRQGQQMQQEMQQRSGEGESPGEGEPQEGEQPGDDPGKEGEQRQDLEIPGREEFRTPEEYRRALLEGMEGEVPEEYRAMKKRYFEELVSQ